MKSRDNKPKVDDQLKEVQYKKLKTKRNIRTVLVVLAAIFFTPLSLFITLPLWFWARDKDTAKKLTPPMTQKEVKKTNNTSDSNKGQLLQSENITNQENSKAQVQMRIQDIEVQQSIEINKLIAERCKQLAETDKGIAERNKQDKQKEEKGKQKEEKGKQKAGRDKQRNKRNEERDRRNADRDKRNKERDRGNAIPPRRMGSLSNEENIGCHSPARSRSGGLTMFPPLGSDDKKNPSPVVRRRGQGS